MPRVTEALAGALDPFDHHVDHVCPWTPAGVLVVWVEVADPQRRQGEGVRLHRPRRAEHDAAGPGEDALHDLETRVALADDEDVAADVLLGACGVDVVRRVLEPGQGRAPRLCHSEREDDGTAAVLTVAGDEHGRLVLSPRRLPRAPVSNLELRSLGERRDPGLHLGPRRQVEGAVHQRRDERLELRLLGEQAVVVVPLVLARRPLDRRVGLCPADEALEDRKTLEHPTRPLVARQDRVPDPQAPEAIAGLEPARTAADHDHVVFAGRVRRRYGRQATAPCKR